MAARPPPLRTTRFRGGRCFLSGPLTWTENPRRARGGRRQLRLRRRFCVPAAGTGKSSPGCRDLDRLPFPRPGSLAPPGVAGGGPSRVRATVFTTALGPTHPRRIALREEPSSASAHRGSICVIATLAKICAGAPVHVASRRPLRPEDRAPLRTGAHPCAPLPPVDVVECAPASARSIFRAAAFGR